MRKMILMSTLLLMTCLVKAQILNVSPTLKKGNVVTYKSSSNNKASGMDVTVTETSKYTVTEEAKDGFVVDMISSDWKVDTDNKMAQLLVAATELVNGINFRLVTDKNGKVKSIKNYDEVKAKISERTNALIDGILKDIPEVGQVLSKEQLKEQITGATSEAELIRSLESNGVLALNGKTIASGAQDEYVNNQGMKMKRFFLVNGKKITATSTLNMTQDDMKKLIIEKVEQMAPEQAKLVKDNIDTLMESGLLKAEGSEKASYELADDGWIKTMSVENTMKIMQQGTSTSITITRQ
ncbi:MAG: hypothetical protein IKY01_06800 [Prevotella sp.]|nr:hypothetical protein [Prevotella sp.]